VHLPSLQHPKELVESRLDSAELRGCAEPVASGRVGARGQQQLGAWEAPGRRREHERRAACGRARGV
jgi:hypothetical protein